MVKENQVFSYLIMEESSPIQTKVNITKEIRDNKLFYVEFDATFQDFNARNRNKNKYNGDMMVKAFQAEHILELLANESFGIEAGHPLNVSTERAMTIQPENVCAVIQKLDVNRDRARGHAKTVDDVSGVGAKMTRMMLQGMNPAFSLRTLANMRAGSDGVRELISPPHIVCYDWVFVPSHKKAYADKDKPVEIIDVNPYTGAKNVVSMVKPITESDLSAIKDMVTMESYNVNMLSNMYEVATNGLIMSNDFKYVVMKEGSTTFYVPLEKKITQDINSFMAKF